MSRTLLTSAYGLVQTDLQTTLARSLIERKRLLARAFAFGLSRSGSRAY